MFYYDMYIDVRLSHLNKDHLLTYLISGCMGIIKVSNRKRDSLSV